MDLLSFLSALCVSAPLRDPDRPMDFFQAQDSAQQRSRLLVLLFTAAVALIASANYAAVQLLLLFDAGGATPERAFPDPGLFASVAGVTLLVILAGTLYRIGKLRRGGPAVAELAGGRAVAPGTSDTAERRLLNIVEEMAIASGVPVPPVYILDEEGINAFAAGHTIHDAAVAVTRGALERLDRDELQGVVAHEFSHILNGDMRLNIRLIGLLYGILLIAVIGRKLLEGRRHSSRRSRDGGSVVLLGLALMAIGYTGVFCGRIIKAAISRQREFLADAAAVQFTRNPGGIAGALKKIGGHTAGSRVRAAHADELSHLFFAHALGRNLFATHPPLVERIRRIDPGFDGGFPAGESIRASLDAPEKAAVAAFAGPAAAAAGTAGGATRETPVPVRAGALISSIGAPTGAHLSRAARLLGSIPPELDSAARTPGGAQALVLALLIDADGEVADRQRGVVRQHGGDELLAWVDDLAPRVREQPPDAPLALLDLSLPALERLPPEGARSFRAAVRELIRADGRLRLFEYALAHVLSRHLPGAPGAGERPARPRGMLHSLAPLREEVEAVLSAVARSGATDEAEVRVAFGAGAASLPPTIGELRLQDPGEVRLARIERALVHLERGSLGVRRRFLEACARCIAHDGLVRPSEVEILRAIGEAIDCPMPPLVAEPATEPRRAVAGG